MEDKMKRVVNGLLLALALSLAAASSCVSQQAAAGPLVGEWYAGLADPEGGSEPVFDEVASLRFDERHIA